MWGTYDDGLKFIQNGGLDNSIEPLEYLTSTGDRSRFVVDGSPISSDFSESESLNGFEEDDRPPLHIMFLGSSLGNFSRPDAASFLKSLPLFPGHGDTLLLGLDHDNDKQLIELAYNDPQGYTKRFIFNGLKAAGRAMGDERMFDEEKWEYVNYYDVVSCILLSEVVHKLEIAFLRQSVKFFPSFISICFSRYMIQVDMKYSSSPNSRRRSKIPWYAT